MTTRFKGGTMPTYVVEALVKTAVLIQANDPFRAQSRARAVLRGQGKDVDSITNVVQADSED
jgi:hypothetical protein